ncbi:sodium:solute symporter [Telluribacter sp.]|jgi:SSS family solute:Na+ symporter|uniref:sodium:solute symporter n=1 Tax=Telluribacter sp. TaxID=1978767 RepID=UPI002E147209|nr:sodium:solute symporter [Telluribacter sp.]
MTSFSLSIIDYVVIGVYLVGIIIYGLRHAKRSNAEEYFLSGRDSGWVIIGISLVAANISSTTIVGLAGDAYSTGIAVYNYEWMATVVLVFFSIFFMPFYLRSQVYTMPEFLERRFDSRSRYYFSFITLVGNIVIDTAGTLYAGAVIMQLIFPGTSITTIAALLALAAAAYTIPGGLSAVMYTEVVQAVLLFVSSIVISTVTFMRIGSWEQVLAVTPPHMLSLVQPADDPSVPWPGLLFGVPLLGFYFWCTNQFMVQRVLSAKNLDHGRWGALFAGLLKLPLLFIMVLPGTMARVLYPDLERADFVFPTLLFDQLPAGLIGLVVAGLLAAMASSISATLNSASTLVTMDFVRKLRPGMSSQQLVRIGQFSTLVFVIFSVLWSPVIASFDTLFKYLQNVLAFLAPPVVAVFLLGLFWKRANASGAFAGLIAGFVAMILLVFYGQNLGIHFLIIAPLLCLFCVVVIVAVSLATAPPPVEKTNAYIWTRRVYEADTAELKGVPWYLNFRVLSVLLLLLTALVVGMFW